MSPVPTWLKAAPNFAPEIAWGNLVKDLENETILGGRPPNSHHYSQLAEIHGSLVRGEIIGSKDNGDSGFYLRRSVIQNGLLVWPLCDSVGSHPK
jgi:hypothetical protein